MRIGIYSFIIMLLILPPSLYAKEQPVTVTIDWTKTDGEINRGIFSTQGFMQVYVEKNPMVMETFELINPSGTHTRLETYISRMEPENDDGDPDHFNWEKFYPQKMIRFIDDRQTFEKVVNDLGMEPLSLLCYQVDWNESGNPERPIKDINEWVEFAAAVVESYNGRGENYRPNLRFVEIWNEPNMEMFYTGTMESYFELFNAAADRIHRDYPDVMVGGPALTHAYHCEPEKWMVEFLKDSAPKADFISFHHYGPQGEPVDVVTNDIKRWVGEFRKIPGKENGKVMITELDAWFHGWPKAQFILERQFRLLDISDLILSIHHFCCLAYNEAGNYTFGIVRENGAVMEGIFWPYWLFRNLMGNKAYIDCEEDDKAKFDLIASHYSNDDNSISSVVFHNKDEKFLEIKTTLKYPVDKNDRVLSINRVTENFKGIDKVLRVPGGSDSMDLDLTLSPGEGLALNLQESGKRVFEFSDLNNQEKPWLDIISYKKLLDFMEACELDVRILNTNFKPVSGKIEIKGLPSGYEVELVSGKDEVDNLAFGEVQECKFQFTASNIVSGGQIAPYAVLSTLSLDETPHSIPVMIEVRNPVSTQTLPLPVYTVPGEENVITIQITNQINKTVEGEFLFSPPTNCQSGDIPTKFQIPREETKRYQFPFTVSKNASLGEKKGEIILKYLGTEYVDEFEIEVCEGKIFENAVPLDLNKYLNFDAVAFNSNRKDYTEKMGLFVYPGDYTPSDRVVNIRGVPYKMASMEDGKKNAVEPHGQVLNVEEGKYKEVAFMGFGHSGKHPGQWVFKYADGSEQTVDSQIPEWCCPTPEGFEIAFNAPHRYIPGGPAPPACQLFTWRLKTDSAKNLNAIKLPVMDNAYIFTITLIR